MEVSEWESQYS